MPIYEYICKECGKEIEVIQKFSDPPLKKCDSCNGGLKKKLSLPSFQLKGGGWYKDGYSKKPPEKKKEGKEAPKEKPKVDPSQNRSERPKDKAGRGPKTGAYTGST